MKQIATNLTFFWKAVELQSNAQGVTLSIFGQLSRLVIIRPCDAKIY